MNEINSILSCLVIILCLLLSAKFLWTRRWLLYTSWRLPGPFSIPFLGSLYFIFVGPKDVVPTAFKFVEFYPPVFRVWVGPQMAIVLSKVEDAEFILGNCLQKDCPPYSYFDDIFTSLLTTKVNTWQKNRKNISRVFNTKTINSFFDRQMKIANRLMKELEFHCGLSTDVLPAIWTTTLDMGIETVGGVDVTTLPEQNSKFLPMIAEFERLVNMRLMYVLYFFDWIWKTSRHYKKVVDLKEQYIRQIREIIARRQEEPDKNNFISRVLQGNYNTPKELEEEVAVMFIAASETSALVTSTVLVVLSIYPEVQKKLFEELEGTSDFTLEDLNNFDYLDRVVKETMRILPPFPLVGRYLEETIQIILDGQVYPERSVVIVPILHLHRKPEFWPDPLKFDPDRFLPEEVKKRPRGAYMPFSSGPRNCIGLKYGMMTVKVLVAKIVKNFEVLPGQYQSLHEIEMIFQGILKPKRGFKMLMRKRESVDTVGN